jgi:AAA domain
MTNSNVRDPKRTEQAQTKAAALRASSWTAEGMDTFLTAIEADIAWLVPDVLAPECMTQFYAPRGLGKSLLADYWAVQLAASGKRVLILDRDNSRHTLRTRLRGFGANDIEHLKVISREKCPPLTKPEEWASFPYSDYDLVIVDSLDAMAEGAGEQDSSKPARAMAPLLDICHREGGPAVLLLGNTIKSAKHSRGCGVIEDRADIVYELRDATDFRPTGDKPWIEELPAQGASEWATRSTRRKGRSRFRLALVATKFRVGEEPAPRLLEIRTEDVPWTVEDVTASIDAAGDAERLRVAEAKTTRIFRGKSILLAEIDSRIAGGRPAILKTAAEILLMAAGHTRSEARTIMASDSFVEVPGMGKGHPVELHRHVKDLMAEMREGSDPNDNADSAQADFCRPHLEHTAEIHPSQTHINTSD